MKNKIFAISLWLILGAIIVSLFIMVVLPKLNQDWEQLYSIDLQTHEQKLDIIKSDLNQVLLYDNVDLNIEGEAVNVVIFGDYCVLRITLNRERKVISYGVEDKTETKETLFVLLGFAMGIAVIVIIFAIGYNIVAIKNIARERKAAKLRKEIDLNILV